METSSTTNTATTNFFIILVSLPQIHLLHRLPIYIYRQPTPCCIPYCFVYFSDQGHELRDIMVSTSAKFFLLFLSLVQSSLAFTSSGISSTNIRTSHHVLNSEASSTTSIERNPKVTPTEEWELDCYSRPVMVGGKKLWEVLITDSNGSFRLCETLPSNR